jgi:hypothetical protein
VSLVRIRAHRGPGCEGKPDPGPVDTAKLLPVAYVVAGVLIVVGVVVIWADLVKPITLS